jgi:hypothetical protein
MRVGKPITKRVLLEHIVDLQRQVLELQRGISKPTLQALVDELVTMRSKEISTLTDHAVKALRLLIDKDVITQAEANEAIR